MNQPATLQNHYKGYLYTPLLWRDGSVFELDQFIVPTIKTSAYTNELTSHFRLGKLVELFVFNELSAINGLKFFLKNIQIIENKTTLGELDCLLSFEGKAIHLEIVYKFYLYDPENGTTELDRWIGPNRKDSFINKLNKLKNKQLPLLKNTAVTPILSSLGLKVAAIEQKVYFKAQLFVPLKLAGTSLPLINNDCIKGFYIKKDQLITFEKHQFYMPTKLDWLLEVSDTVAWCNYSVFLPIIEKELCNEHSPLCWLKDKDGKLSKAFIVFW